MTISREELQMKERLEGSIVSDGASISIREDLTKILTDEEQEHYYQRFHINLQHTMTDGTVIRFKIIVPKDTGNDPYTWIISKAVKEEGLIHGK